MFFILSLFFSLTYIFVSLSFYGFFPLSLLFIKKSLLHSFLIQSPINSFFIFFYDSFFSVFLPFFFNLEPYDIVFICLHIYHSISLYFYPYDSLYLSISTNLYIFQKKEIVIVIANFSIIP